MAKKSAVEVMPAEPQHRKPTHDGRIPYMRTLQMVLASVKMYSIQGEYAMWYRSLRNLHSMINPYCQQNLMVGIDEKFKRANVLLGVVRNLQQSPYRRYGGFNTVLDARSAEMAGELDEVLREIEFILHYASKDMMLPLGGVDEYDLDLAKVLERSGL